jgi:poly-gamma-glutamate capsule biosynthesis protein CapA/YwtB (metallophosphatase superfamily)
MTTRRNLLLLPVGTLALGFRRGPTRQAPVPLPSTRLVFGGDVMLGRHVGRLARNQRDPEFPFRALAPLLVAADLAFVNLESPFSDRGPILDAQMVFKAEPEMIDALRLAGVDVVSTANNHARDCGSYGLEFTLDRLAKSGIAAVGSGRSEDEVRQGVVLERNGVRFGFLAYTYDQANGNYPVADPRVAMLDIERMREDVGRLRQRTHVVVVSMHAGQEYSPQPNTQQMEFARAAIDAGARLVVGHHPHVVQPAEHYRGGVIFYSLGNLVFDQFQRKETQQGMLAEVTFRGKHLESVLLRPVRIVRTAPRLMAAGDV